MSVEIARCPTHGLHGSRATCFVCGGPVEQVRFVAETEIAREAALVEALAHLTDSYVELYRILPGRSEILRPLMLAIARVAEKTG